MELENIDDDCDQNDIAFVKIDDDNEAAEWGIDDIPTIVSVLIFGSSVYFRSNFWSLRTSFVEEMFASVQFLNFSNYFVKEI